LYGEQNKVAAKHWKIGAAAMGLWSHPRWQGLLLSLFLVDNRERQQLNTCFHFIPVRRDYFCSLGKEVLLIAIACGERLERANWHVTTSAAQAKGDPRP